MMKKQEMQEEIQRIMGVRMDALSEVVLKNVQLIEYNLMNIVKRESARLFVEYKEVFDEQCLRERLGHETLKALLEGYGGTDLVDSFRAASKVARDVDSVIEEIKNLKADIRYLRHQMPALKASFRKKQLLEGNGKTIQIEITRRTSK